MTYMCVAQVTQPRSATVEVFCIVLISTRAKLATPLQVNRTDAIESLAPRIRFSSLAHLHNTHRCVLAAQTRSLRIAHSVNWSLEHTRRGVLRRFCKAISEHGTDVCVAETRQPGSATCS